MLLGKKEIIFSYLLVLNTGITLWVVCMLESFIPGNPGSSIKVQVPIGPFLGALGISGIKLGEPLLGCYRILRTMQVALNLTLKEPSLKFWVLLMLICYWNSWIILWILYKSPHHKGLFLDRYSSDRLVLWNYNGGGGWKKKNPLQKERMCLHETWHV